MFNTFNTPWKKGPKNSAKTSTELNTQVRALMLDFVLASAFDAEFGTLFVKRA
jgi:hypothetical protein